MPDSLLSLAGVRVLVTRPTHQSQLFIDLIKLHGGVPFPLPTISIEFEKKPLLLDGDTGMVIFTSVNAVIGANLAGHQLTDYKNSDRADSLNRTNPAVDPAKPKIAAIGNATSQALRERGIRTILTPENKADSESLLEILKPQIQPGMKVVIVRGDSGRDFLRDSLLTIGACVQYVQVYRRNLPAMSRHEVAKVWHTANPDIVSISSDLGLANLITLLPDSLQQKLQVKPLVVNSNRCLHKARESGFSAAIKVASPAGDHGQIEQLIKLANTL